MHTPAGVLYDGPDRRTVLAMLYAVLAYETPSLLPSPEELDWVAGLGEDAAVDVTCAALDRAARLLLDDDRWRLWNRIEAALAAGESGADRRVRDVAITLGRELRAGSLRGSLAGARHTLDAVLLAPYGGRRPGDRIRAGGRPGTVIGVRWPESGPPTAYELRADGDMSVRLLGVASAP